MYFLPYSCCFFMSLVTCHVSLLFVQYTVFYFTLPVLHTLYSLILVIFLCLGDTVQLQLSIFPPTTTNILFRTFCFCILNEINRTLISQSLRLLHRGGHQVGTMPKVLIMCSQNMLRKYSLSANLYFFITQVF